jgi:hypothetical protein
MKRRLGLGRVNLDLMRIPRFLMGSSDGAADEPVSLFASSARSGWHVLKSAMPVRRFFGARQPRRRQEHLPVRHHGYPANEAAQPVVRVCRGRRQSGFVAGSAIAPADLLAQPGAMEWACRWRIRRSASVCVTPTSRAREFRHVKLQEFASDPPKWTNRSLTPPYDDWIPETLVQ